jgi:amino-acid N-acetyltransferase
MLKIVPPFYLNVMLTYNQWRDMKTSEPGTLNIEPLRLRQVKMKYSFAIEDNGSEIRRLLADSDLHHEDITTAQLKHFILGWDGPKLVAVVGLEIKSRSALLRSLAIDAEYRNRGIATRLVGQIEDYAKSMGLGSLYLLTLTAEDFFKKCGYRPIARDSAPAEIQETTEFRSLCPASAVCMVRHLGAE